ncbi:MAG: hypothetical protein U0228_02955 [Myxococcaceae bacterium]
MPSTTPTTTPRPATTATPMNSTPAPAPAPTGYSAQSSFRPGPNTLTTRGGTADDTIGREGMFADTMGRKKGTADDTIGRAKGTADDTIGRGKGTADDTIGRTKGTADDTIGRKKGTADDTIGRKKGTADDTIGNQPTFEEARAALAGRSNSADAVALRSAINQSLETPNFLKSGSGSITSRVFDFAKQTMKLSATQVGQLTTALKGASDSAAKLIGALVEKAPEALTNTDSKGQTLLSNLARFQSQQLNPKLAGDTTKDELFTSMLRDMVNPNRIDQGDAPTCTVTSMQFELVADQPSEYARLLTDLSGPQGRAKMMGGSELQLQDGDGAVRDERSISQTLFQTATMEFGNGRNLDFDPSQRGSVDSSGKLVQHGLHPEQQTQVLRQLFGVNYRSELFQTEAEGSKALERLKKYDVSANQNRPVILSIDQGNFNHAVTYQGVNQGRVYFRDPYGELKSMPEDQFKTFVVGMNAPKDANIID